MSKEYCSNDHTGCTFLSANTDDSKFDDMLNDPEAAAWDALKAAGCCELSHKL
jgi:hypothetical protein